MREREPSAKIIRFVCEHCGKMAEVEGSRYASNFILRVKFAHCNHCSAPRREYTVESGYFECASCHVVYRRRRETWSPRHGLCPVCYMRARRKGELPTKQP